MGKKKNGRHYHYFLLHKNWVTDFVETWDLHSEEDLVSLRNGFQSNLANKTCRTKVLASSANLPNKISWMKCVQIITPDQKTLKREKIVFDNLNNIEIFLKATVENSQKTEHRFYYKSKTKIQNKVLSYLEEEGKFLLAADGSMVPPYYCGWAVIGPTGVLQSGNFISESSVSSNLSEIHAFGNALQLVHDLKIDADVSTDCLFVTQMVNGIKSNTKLTETKLKTQIGKGQLEQAKVDKFKETVRISPQVKVLKTKGHSDDPLNNYADLVSRENARKGRNQALIPFNEAISKRNTRNKLILIHTGNFITDGWSIAKKEDLPKILEDLEDYKDRVLFITDTSGDNNWIRTVLNKGFKHIEVPEDETMYHFKNYLYKLNNINSSISFEEKVQYQNLIFKLFLLPLNKDRLTSYIYSCSDYAIICGSWFETSLFEVYDFDIPWEEKEFLQSVLNICHYTDAKTTLVIKGPSNYITSTRTSLQFNNQKLEIGPKTRVRKPRNGESNIFKLAGILQTHGS